MTHTRTKLSEAAKLSANAGPPQIRYATIDGLPGFVTIEDGNIAQTTALHVEEGRIVGIYVTRNPDKL